MVFVYNHFYARVSFSLFLAKEFIYFLKWSNAQHGLILFIMSTFLNNFTLQVKPFMGLRNVLMERIMIVRPQKCAKLKTWWTIISGLLSKRDFVFSSGFLFCGSGASCTCEAFLARDKFRKSSARAPTKKTPTCARTARLHFGHEITKHLTDAKINK